VGIYHFDGNEFVPVQGQLNVIAAAANGATWGINQQNQIFRFNHIP
jgi:hypothetical protein